MCNSAAWFSLGPCGQHHEGHAVKCWTAAIEHVPGPVVVVAIVTPLAFLKGLAPLGRAHAPACFDGSRDVFRQSRCELHEFAAGTFQREAMLVFPAFRIRAERRHAEPVLAFDGLRVPST